MVNPPLVDCSVFLLSNTARAPESAPAPFNGTSIGCSLCCLLSNSQMCLTKPHWATGSSGGVASPSVHQQPTLLRHPWVWLVATTAGSWTVRVCQTEGEEKAVRCLPDLTGPPRRHSRWTRGPSLAPPLRSNWTSDVGARVPEGPRKLRSPSQLLNRLSWRPCLDLGVLEQHLPQDHPPFL